MKHFFLIILLMPLLTACPNSSSEKEKEDSAQTFRDNQYNFPSWKKQKYKNIRFKIPKSFEFDYGNQYCYKSSALTRRDFSLGIIFTVERFTEDDLESELMEDYMIEKDLLNGFHDAYVERRYESLHQSGVSFKKDTKKNVKHKGVIQTLFGRTSDYADDLYYATATLKIKKEYYIFQCIAKKDMMDYVYDDFERILTTVRSR